MHPITRYLTRAHDTQFDAKIQHSAAVVNTFDHFLSGNEKLSLIISGLRIIKNVATNTCSNGMAMKTKYKNYDIKFDRQTENYKI